jgi:hypothetical protein
MALKFVKMQKMRNFMMSDGGVQAWEFIILAGR